MLPECLKNTVEIPQQYYYYSIVVATTAEVRITVRYMILSIIFFRIVPTYPIPDFDPCCSPDGSE